MSGTSAPLVSVIVPAYNAERTLRRTLESAASQSWAHIEIIIVDDGSTDRTADIATAFCVAEKRARLIRQENGGEAAARNTAISEAIGEWIAPLDADDLWHPQKIERQLRAAELKPDAGLVYCWSRMIDTRDQVIGDAPSADFEGEVILDHLRSNFIGNGSTPLISRDALGELRYDAAFDACADYLLQLQLAMKTQFAVVRAYLTGYRGSDTNVSSDAVRMIRGHVRMFELVLPMLQGEERQIAKRELSRWRTKLGLVLLRRGRVSCASSNILGGLRANPAATGSELLDQLRLIVGLKGRPETVQTERLFQDLAPDEGLR